MSIEQDQARSIAERVAQRVKGQAQSSTERRPPTVSSNGGPMVEELSAIREGLHDLENKLERIESRISNSEPAGRARVIDFVSSSPPVVRAATAAVSSSAPVENRTAFVPATHSPWIRDFANIDHPSQEKFGVEEATVAELVEFFENEKKCSIEPGGKPCDHCAMCSSRGF
jgi:hypothetical protein